MSATPEHLSLPGLRAENKMLRERLERAEAALKEIVETARWYAENDARLQHEVDHALCVEVLSCAEDALLAGGVST